MIENLITIIMVQITIYTFGIFAGIKLWQRANANEGESDA